MSLKQRSAIIFTLAFGLIAAVYAGQFDQQLSATIFLVPPLLAVLMGIYASRAYHISGLHGKALSLLTAGIACLLIGEVLFYMYQFAWNSEPFPSLADVFYLAAYPLILAALVLEIRAHRPKFRDFNPLILLLSGLFLATLTLVVVYFGVFKAYSADETLLSNSISIAYGLADLILIVPCLFVLKIALDYRGGKLFTSWILVLFAIISMMVADILFSIYSKNYADLDWPYTLIDLFWVASYLLFAYSFFYTGATIKQALSKLQKL